MPRVTLRKISLAAALHTERRLSAAICDLLEGVRPSTTR